MRTVADNAYEAAARERKVGRLLLAAHSIEADAAYLESEECDWDKLAKLAEINPPSDTTKQAAIDAQRAFEARSAKNERKVELLFEGRGE